MPAHRVVATSQVPWREEPNIAGFRSKTLFVNSPSGASANLYWVPPDHGVQVMFRRPTRHFHRTVVERSFALGGDYPHWEFRNPDDTTGELIVFRRGTFMDRPPLSLHGLQPEPRSQVGATVLNWDTGGGVGLDDPRAKDETVTVPFRDYERYNIPFTSPRIFRHDEQPWRAHPRVSGWKAKALAPRHGTAAEVALVALPADAVSKQAVPGTHERRWLFVVSGSLRVAIADADGEHRYELTEEDFLEWFQPAKLRFDHGTISDVGAVVLCIGHQLS